MSKAFSPEPGNKTIPNPVTHFPGRSAGTHFILAILEYFGIILLCKSIGGDIMEERKKETHERRGLPALMRETMEIMGESMRYRSGFFS